MGQVASMIARHKILIYCNWLAKIYQVMNVPVGSFTTEIVHMGLALNVIGGPI